MKNHFVEKSARAAWLLGALLFVVSSCDNEDEFNPLLASIQVPAGLLDSDSKVYLLASDSEGEIIEFAEIQDGATTQLVSDTYTESTFTLSIVTAYSDLSYKDLYGSSYHGVRRGVKIVVPESADEEVDYFQFTTQNFDAVNASYYTLASNGDASSIYPDDTSGDLYLSKSPTRFFITKYNLNYEPIGFQFPTTTYTAAQTPAVNLAGTYAAFQSETVNFTESSYAGVTVYGRVAADNFTELYEVSESSTGSTSLSIKYPGTTFPAYASSSYVEGFDYYYEAYHKSQRSDFSMLDVDATVEITGQTIDYSITSNGDVVSFDFDQDGSESEYFGWDIYAPTGANKSVTIPKLPTEITSTFSAYSYAGWTNDEDLEVMQIEGVDSVDEYILAEMDENLSGSVNAKYVYLYLGSGVAREARLNLVQEKKHHTKLGGYKNRFEVDRNKR